LKFQRQYSTPHECVLFASFLHTHEHTQIFGAHIYDLKYSQYLLVVHKMKFVCQVVYRSHIFDVKLMPNNSGTFCWFCMHLCIWSKPKT